jgi:hypothetical protein
MYDGQAKGEGEMRATKLQELEQMAVKLLATARKLPPGPERSLAKAEGTRQTGP